MNTHPLDVEKVMKALVRRTPGPFSKESLPMEVAFEIRQAFPDSKLLVGVPLREGDHRLEIDILGMVNGRKLAVKLSNGAGSRADCSRALADLQRICAAAPELDGLALAIVHCSDPPQNIGDPWPAWRACDANGSEGWGDAKYAYTWVAAAPVLGI